MTESPFILVFADHDFRLVGPFDNKEALIAWGQKWQAANNDDPRWQSISPDLTFVDGDTFCLPITEPVL